MRNVMDWFKQATKISGRGTLIPSWNLYPLNNPTMVFLDNLLAIKLSSGVRVSNKRSGHFGIDSDVFREYVTLGEMKIVHRDGKDLLADMLTKALPALLFAKHRYYVMGGENAHRHFQTKRTRVVHDFKPSVVLVQHSQSGRRKTSHRSRLTYRHVYGWHWTWSVFNWLWALFKHCRFWSQHWKTESLFNECEFWSGCIWADWNCGSSVTWFCWTTGDQYWCGNRNINLLDKRYCDTLVNTNPVAVSRVY